MYTTIIDFVNFLRNALEQEYNTGVECELFSRIIKLKDNIIDTEADENDIIISDTDTIREINIDIDYENAEEIFYSECHFFDKNDGNRICIILYAFPITDNLYSTITNCYQKPFYISYFLDSLNCCEELGIIADAINKSLLDITNDHTGKISELDYNNVLNRINNNKQLILKKMS